MLLFAAAAMIAAACSQNSVEGEIEIPLPDYDCNAEGFVNAIKSIEVINLQVDSNSMYNEEANLLVSPNYYYFISKGLHLMCYEKATGKLLCSKSVMGRSRAECTNLSNSFVFGDSLVINDYGKLKMYDQTGKFCGLLGDVESYGSGSVLPLGNGYISCNKWGTPNKSLTVFDSAFNAKGSYFEVPDEYKFSAAYHISNTSPDVYVFNDTLRFYYQFVYRLHSFPGNNTYHFVTTNPYPESKLKNIDGGKMFETLNDIRSNGYASNLYDLTENQEFISFKYDIGDGQKRCIVLLSKRNNSVYCIKAPRDNWESPLDVWAVIFGSQFLYSDGKYFYVRAHKQASKFLDDHKNILDDRQRAILDTMQARLARTDEQDFNFYYKIEF